MMATAHVVLHPSYATTPTPRPHPPSDEITLVALTSAERFAGLFTKHAAIAWGLRPVAEAAQQIAVELITRAVETTGNPDPHPNYTEMLNPPPLIGIRITRTQTSGLLIDVWDSDPTPPLPAQGSHLSLSIDHHLAAVQLASHAWNWYPHGGGKVIWATLTTHHAPPSPHTPPRAGSPETSRACCGAGGAGNAS
jgi:hypothetical protein